ncbi:MAG: carboxypeptidase regulatory-like domain-containing protein [Thaumarchaeota archaeon]|nr:carboxypeptidase regulatory-like domain-containing protein [Nitrososphaerota archaeon]
MNKHIIFATSLLLVGFVVAMSSIKVSESVLSNKMLVSVKAEKDPIMEGEFPTIVGNVTNEAYKPVANANVLIMFGTTIVSTSTDDQGKFRYQATTPSTHGIYEVDVTVTKDGYTKALGNNTFTVSPRQTVTISKTINGLPIETGNYTVFLGKVTQWNLETTCFVSFADKYMRFLHTCDLYSMEPEDFQTDQQIIPMVSVISDNHTYKLFPENIYLKASNMANNTLETFIENTFANYTNPQN